MYKVRITLRVLTLVTFAVACAAVAQAQATRTWVSGVGDDVNPCSRTAPCKTFAGAISKTATGGEISVLDPGGYGTLTVTKAITVDGGTGAGWGSTLASGTNGFVINITTNLSTDKVILRNLSINGAGTTLGTDGIRFLDGAELTIENVSIFNFSGDAIDIAQTQNSATHIRNVTINNVPNGIKVNTTTGQTTITVEDSSIRATTVGFDAVANVRASLKNSTFDQGSSQCIRTNGTNSIVNADDLFISGCGTGVRASSGSTINIGDSMIVQNSTGLSLNLGTINSMQGNTLFSNTTAGAFSSTQAKQ
jgi:hypothetical protein